MTTKQTIEILELLRQDCRMNYKTIATMTGATEQEVAAEIARLEQERIIVKYNALINMDKVDDEIVQAVILVNVTPARESGFEAIAERIYRFNEVQSVYLVSGSFDLLVIIEGLSMKRVALFVAEKLSVLDGVTATNTNFVLRKYKQDGVILVDEAKDKRLVVTA